MTAELADEGGVPEILDAGFWPRNQPASSRSGASPSARSGPRSGFETGGALDTRTPDAPLAGLADAATREGRLAGLSDDELIGVMRAWQRLGSWCSSNMLMAVAELARRRPADRTPAAAPGEFPAQLSEFISDEVAAALTLTGLAASDVFDVALDLAIRLPATARAHHEGVIDYRRAKLIADATRILTDEHAREVESRILPAAGNQTTGRLRATLARAVIAVDPQAAARRREEAQRDPRVRRWQEDAGTAAMAGYSLPPADVLAADQRLTERALALHAAGWPGSLEELRARAYLDALLGQDSKLPAGPADPTDPAEPVTRTPRPSSGQPGRPSLAARVNLTVPLTTNLGLSADPGTVGGFGPVDPSLARHLVSLGASHPASRFCITITGADDRAVGHGCLPGPGRLAKLTTDGLTLSITPLADGSCDHRHQEPGYQPSRRLRHLVQARNLTCTAPGCQRPAARCDLDHTTPYDQGGRTCECNLAPLCRRHHRCKQSQGWRLEQPSPGIMHWTTPAGRRYVIERDAYP